MRSMISFKGMKKNQRWKNKQKHIPLVVRIYPDPTSYNIDVGIRGDPNRTTDNNLFTKLLNKYQGAWEKLSKM